MMVPGLKAAAEFFAKLANQNADENFFLAEDLHDSLVEECKRVCIALGYPLEQYFPEEFGDPGEEVAEEWDMEATVTALWREHVWPTLRDLFKREVVPFPGQPSSAYLEADRRTLVEEPFLSDTDIVLKPDEFLIARFYQLLRSSPFPFGQCRFCPKVFLQSRKGKPRKYCSATCKQKGIPSAATRTADIRERRREHRRREIEQTRQILQRWPEERGYWPRLQKEFPRKSRRELLYLSKQAKRSAHSRKEEEK